MKSQKISLSALIILTAVSTPFNPNSPAPLSIPAAFSQPLPSPSLPHGSEACDVRSQSMSHTIEINDHVVINQIAYSSQSPKHGDIIVFKPTQSIKENSLASSLNDPLVRRVIGLPGETVKVVDGKVYINDQPLEENYLREKPNYLFAPVKIPSNSYFVLGDNRNNSYDSHVWGFVPQELIIGQVVRTARRKNVLRKTQLISDFVKQASNNTGCNLF